jgi:hypothetical protein
MKELMRVVMVFCLIVFLAVPAFGDSSSKDLEMQMQKLIKQIKDMEAGMNAQKAEIKALQSKINELKTKEAAPSVAAAAAKEEKVTSKFKIDIYGKIKLDTIVDTNNMGRDDFITFVPRTADGQGKTSFNVRDTRLGIAIDGPSVKDWQATARFESDFYGGNATDNNGQLRLRLAYVDMANSVSGTSFRVGQDWTPVQSLNPSTIDFAIMGFNGNLWNRVPQVTLRQNVGEGFEALLSAYRYLAGSDSSGSPELRMPWVGGKLAYSASLFENGQKAYFAVDGAIRNGKVKNNNVTPYLFGLEAKLPLPYVELTGEAYMGQGLGLEYFHQSGGDFNAEGNAILTRGGWIQASVKPIKDVTVNLGYGLDNPKDSQVGTAFDEESRYAFGNIMVELFKGISVGTEIAHVKTDWATGAKEGTRYQTSLWYLW